MSQIAKLVGDRIKNLRNQKGWSQEELAHRASLNKSYLSEVECGVKVARIDVVAKIADALEINLGELFGYIPSETDNNATLAKLIEKLNNLSIEDQEKMLNLLDAVFQWIKK